MKHELKRIFAQPAFAVAFVVLGLAAVGLNGATQLMQLHFKKQPVPLARPLTAMPLQFGPWHQVSLDTPLAHDMEDALQTKEYVFRQYVDERIVGKEFVEQLNSLDPDQRQVKVWQAQVKNPSAVVNLAVTYYTGMVDTVAHIPDRCVIADGYAPKPGGYTIPTWRVGDRDLEVRFVNFEDQTSRGRVDRSVAYFFHVNGHYESDPIGVRVSLQNLLEKHGYYAKVELMTLVRNPDESARVMSDFLSNALPEIESSLPDWQAVKAEKLALAAEQPGESQPSQPQ